MTIKLTSADVVILRKAIDAGTFKESDHPRVKGGPGGGQFTSGGGGKGSSKAKSSPSNWKQFQQQAFPKEEKPAEEKIGKRLRERNKVAQEMFGKNFNDLPPGPYKGKVKEKVRELGLIRPKAALGAKLGIAGQVGYGFQKKMANEMFGKGFNELSTGEKRQVKDALRARGIVRPANLGEAEADEYNLREAKVTSQKKLEGGGVNLSIIMNLEGGLKGVFKAPTAGWAGDEKTEVGAWEVGKLCGMEDIMSPCVFREIDGYKGTLMKFWEGKVAKHEFDKAKKYDGERDLHRAAALDYIIANSDRHEGNWMISPEGRLQLIDNGFSFKDRPFLARGGFLAEAKVRTQKGVVSPITPAEAAAPYLKALPQIEASLRKTGLSERQIAGVRNRIGALANTKDWASLVAA